MSRANSSAVSDCQAGVERRVHRDAATPSAFEPVGAGLGVHQAEGRRVGGEVFAGMRLEGDDAQGGCGGFGGDLQDRLVAEVHAVEIADGGGRALVGVGQVAGVAVDAHGMGRSVASRDGQGEDTQGLIPSWGMSASRDKVGIRHICTRGCFTALFGPSL